MKTLLRNRELSALLAILALFALLIALNPAWFNLQILAMILPVRKSSVCWRWGRRWSC